MEDVLLRLCRITHRMSKRQIAASLGITPTEYRELETGAAAMTPEQAKFLEDLYNIKADYFLESSRQLELLKTRWAIIQQQKGELQRLNILLEAEKVKHQSKQKAS